MSSSSALPQFSDNGTNVTPVNARSVNIQTGQTYKINNVNLSATDVGAMPSSGGTITGSLVLAPTVTGTLFDIQAETEWTTGTLMNLDFASATVQSGDMVGTNLDFNSNLAGVTDLDVTGHLLKLPALTQTAANTTNYIGWNLPTAGALVQNTNAGTINWKGINLQLPNITQTTGTVNSYGFYINGGTVTSGTQWSIFVDSGNVRLDGTLGDTTNRVSSGWFTDLTVTNAIAGSVTGNAATVSNATLTTALTVDTGTVTLTGNVANSSVLTIGAGAVSVSGSNTGDNAANSSTMYIGTTQHALNRGSAAETLAGITLTTSDIGTPSAGVLTNCTGLPVSGLANGTDGQLITWDAAGVAATVATGNAGQILTSNGAGAAPTFQAAPVGGLTWSEVTADTAGAVDNGYITNKAGTRCVVTLPTTAAVGKTVRCGGKGATGWQIAQNANEIIHFLGTDTTTGVGGSLASTGTYDAVELVCVVQDTEWACVSSMGIITVT